ncbi:hypothetical protein ACLOJK_041035 [Asimina triloba]
MWWHSTRGAFLRWCEGLPLSEGSGVLLRSEPVGPLGPSSGTRSSSRGSRASTSRRADDRAQLVERPKKRKQLIDVDVVGGGHQPVVANEGVGEDVKRQNEENLRSRVVGSNTSPEARNDAPGLVSSLARVAASSEVSSGPIPKGSSPRGLVSPFRLGDAAGASPSPNPTFNLVVPEASKREDTGENASRAKTFMLRREGSSAEGGSLIRCGILASIFGEASSCPSNEEIFRQPFNMEARAMKILEDLLPVESRGIRENYALGLPSFLDVEGRGLGEQMLKKFLPDVWREL